MDLAGMLSGSYSAIGTRRCAATARPHQGIACKSATTKLTLPAPPCWVDTQQVSRKTLSSADWSMNMHTPPDARKPAGHELNPAFARNRIRRHVAYRASAASLVAIP